MKRETYQQLQLSFIVIIYMFCFFTLVNKADIFNDESAYYFISRLPLINMISFDVHPPLYPIILSIFPNNIILLRWVSCCFGLVSLITLYYLCNLLYNNDELSSLAVCFFLLHPFFIKSSLMATPYALALMLSLLSTYFYIKVFFKKRRDNMLQYFVFSLLMLMSHDFTVFLLLTHMILLLLYYLFRNKSFGKPIIKLDFYYLLKILKMALLVFASLLIIFVINAIKVLMKPELNFREWSWSLPFGTLLYFNGGSAILTIIFIILLMGLFYYKEIELISLGLWLIPVILALLTNIFINLWHDRYFLFFVPYIMVFLAYSVMIFTNREYSLLKKPQIQRFAVIIILILILSMGFFQNISLVKDSPLRDSLKELGCSNKLFIHTSSFSFLPYEMMGCHNNLLIDNVTYYNTPITLKNQLIKDIQGLSDYYLVSQNTSLIVGDVVFDNKGLLIQYIS